MKVRKQIGMWIKNKIFTSQVEPRSCAIPSNSLCQYSLHSTVLDVILTAAHCVGPGTATVGPDKVQRDIVSGTQHPNYNSGNDSFDIMVMKLASPVPSPARPIKINSNANNPSGTQSLQVIGVGATSEGGPASNGLRKVTVNHVPYETCNAQYGGEISQNSMICASAAGKGEL